MRLKHRLDLFVQHCLAVHLWSKQVGIAMSVARNERTTVDRQFSKA
jgi:hypothetical protein